MAASAVSAPLPPDEPARLDSLLSYGILDTPPEAAFDDLTALAATICGTSIALIALADRDRFWYKSSRGTPDREVPRDVAICAHTILQRELVVIPDVSKHPRFADNPHVRGEAGIRFYAALPLITTSGHALGTLCVLDRVPHELNEAQIRALRVLARYAMSEMELRKANRELAARTEHREAELAVAHETLRGQAAERAAARQALIESHLQLHLTLEATNIGVWETDLATLRTAFNDRVREIFGLPQGRFMIGIDEVRATVHPDDAAGVEAELSAVLRGSSQYRTEYRILRPDGSVRWTLVRGQVERSADGKRMRLRGVTLDITELREAENQRRALIERGQEQMRQAAAQMQALSRELVDAQELEQRRISAELHDRIGQNLTALALNLDMMSSSVSDEPSSALADRLRDSKTLLKASIGSVRDLMSALRPAALEDYGPVAALTAHAADVQARTGLTVDLRGIESIPRQAPAIELALFRIAQEALNNAVKHAQASRVTVHITHTAGTMRICVADDGRGFDPGAVPNGHWGLVIMRERAETVGGTLDVSSRPGSGTTVCVTVPVAT